MFTERLPLNDKSYFKPDSIKMGDNLKVGMREYGAKYPVLLPVFNDGWAAHGYLAAVSYQSS